MREIIQLTKDQIQLFQAQGHVIHSDEANYYHLPQWFKFNDTGKAEMLYEDQLPDNVKLFIRNVSIKEALQRLIELQTKHRVDGYSQTAEWDEAFDDAITALNYDI